MMAQFEGIDSLITTEDAKLLSHYAGMTAVDGLCIEIGSYQGASAYSILQGLPLKYDLVCSSIFWAQEYSRFRLFMIRENMWHRIVPVVGDFRSLWNHITQRSIAFAFIDHDHTEDGMRDAMGIILPNCVSGTLLMFHDCGHEGYPAVQHCVDDLINAGTFNVLHKEPIMAVIRKT